LVPFRQIIMTQNLSSTYRDWQKTRHRDADANSLNRRAVICNKLHTRDNFLARLFPN